MRCEGRMVLATSLLLATAGCAGSGLAPVEPIDLVEPGELVQRRAGADLAVVQRPTPGFVQLSLWLDAGSADVAPPQLATVAAWVAAASGGEEVRAEVWPDAIELSTACAPSRLAPCLQRLARAVSARHAAPAVLAAARSRLERDRRSALSADPGRRADELALRALLGERAHALFPLGEPSADGALEAAAVERFLAAHFGQGRALVVAAGEVEMPALESAIQTAFASIPAATRRRAARAWSLLDGGGVAVAIDNLSMASGALWAPDLARARGAALALVSALQRQGLARGVTARAFALRGAALSLVRVSDAPAERVVHQFARELERMRREGVSSSAGATPDERLDDLVRRVGLQWATRGRAPAETRVALGVGVLARGQRGDRVHAADPDAKARASLEHSMQQAFAAGRASARPRLEGTLDARDGALSLPNGARLWLRRQAGERVLVALRFGTGPRHEPPSLHGRAALLSTLMTTACHGLPPPALASRLRALGATLEPRIEADSWGFSLSVPAQHWREGLDLALGCGLHPPLRTPLIAAARARLQGRMSAADDLLAETAYLVAPAAPAALAPLGHRARLANVTRADLAELWTKSARGGALSVALIGPLELEPAARHAAHRMAVLPAGALDDVAGSAAASAPELERPPAQRYHEALAVWRSPGPGSSESGARAFAAWVRASLSALPQVQARWHAAGATAHDAWAAVVVSAPPARLSALQETLVAITDGPPPPQLTQAAQSAHAAAQRKRALRAGGAAGIADRLAAAPFRAPNDTRAREPAPATAERLWRGPVVWRPLP